MEQRDLQAYTWLQPAGQVLVVDGLWSRAGWIDDQMGDALPLSSLQTRGTIAYLLEQVGFQVGHNGWLERVNQALGGAQTSPRYLVIVRKPGEPTEDPLSNDAHRSR